MIRHRGCPFLTVLTALLMGATVHATANTILSSVRLLGLVSTSVRILYFCWLMLAGLFTVGAAVWLFRAAQRRIPRATFALIFWGATVPSIATEREAFTVLPFVFNVYLDVAGVHWGMNMIGAAAFAFVLITMRSRSTLSEG